MVVKKTLTSLDSARKTLEEIKTPAKKKRAPRKVTPKAVADDKGTPTVSVVDYRRFQTEKQFQSAVVGYARACGWYVMFTWNSRNSPFGEPDLRMIRKGDKRVVYAELKTEKGKLSPHQVIVGEILSEIGGNVHYYLWRPEHWEDGTIERVLQ